MSFGIPLSKVSISSSSPTDIQNVNIVSGLNPNIIISGSTIDLGTKVTASQGGEWFVTASGDVGYLRQSPARDLFVTGTMTTVQGTNPWTVAATNLDIRDLTYTSDSVTVYGDNGVPLQQDGNNKLIVVDSAVSSALNDNKTTLSGAIAANATQLSASLASFATTNNANLLAISGALNAVRLEVSGVHVTLDTTISGALNTINNDILATNSILTSSISGALNDIRVQVSGVNNTLNTTISGAINDSRNVLSGAIASFAITNHADLLAVSGALNAVRLEVSGVHVTLDTTISGALNDIRNDVKTINTTLNVTISGAIAQSTNTISGAIAQSTNILSGAIANSGTSLSSSIASFANVNHADILALSASISASFNVTNTQLTAISGAINDTKTTLSTSLANFQAQTNTNLLNVSSSINDTKVTLSASIAGFQNQTNTNLLNVSSSINDTKLTLSTSLAGFQTQNNTNLLNVSSSIVSSQNVLSNSLAAIFNELNSGDVDIRNLVYTTDSVTAYQGSIWGVTASGDVGMLRQAPSTRDLFVTGAVYIVGANGQPLSLSQELSRLLISGSVVVTNSQSFDLTASIDNVEIFGRNLTSQTKYPILTDTVGHLSVSQGPSGSLPWKVTLTDNTGSLIGTVANPLAVKATEAIPVVTSEAQWPTYIVQLTASNVGSSAQTTYNISNNKSMMSLYHDIGGSTADVVKIQKIHIINMQNRNVNGIVATFELRRITGHSGGELLLQSTYDTMDVVDPFVTARTGATVTGESATLFQRWAYSTDEWAISATKIEAFDHTYNSLFPVYRYEDTTRIKPITLRTGEGIHLKFVNFSGSPVEGNFDIVLTYTIEPDVIG